MSEVAMTVESRAYVPVPLAERHPAAERLTSRERAGADRVGHEARLAPQLPSVSKGRRWRRRVKVDLRYSMVMITILGPCKALDLGPGVETARMLW